MDLEYIRKMDAGRVLRAMMCAFTAAFFIAAFLAPDLPEMFSGLWRICTQPAQLTKDYFHPALGSVSGAMLNTALVGAVCCALMFLPEARVTGGTVLGYFLTVGYCAFGMNIVNILPIMLGVGAYGRIKKLPAGQCLNLFMFSTGVSPIVTQVLFYYPNADGGPHFTLWGVALALLVGLLVGFAMPALCAHSPAFHKGYNLYNAGPAAGFLSFALCALLYKVTGFEAPAITATLGESHPAFVNGFCITVFALCALLGAILNGGFKGYGRMLRDTGYRSDFTAKYSAGLNLLNVGATGLLGAAYYNLIGARFTGPTMTSMICMACCACAGATPANMLPIMLGYGVMGLMNHAGLTAFPLNAQADIVGLCFACGMAPLAGEFGPVAGIAAGALHYGLVTGVPAIHGGFNLYNGGFTSGIVCFFLVPLFEHYFKSRRELPQKP